MQKGYVDKLNIIVVGSGFSGSVIARELAERLNQPVKIIEKRPHIAGNMYDEMDQHGIIVQKYGPHTLFTNNYAVVRYLKKFGEEYQYFVKLKSEIDGRYVRLPFNLLTLQQLVGADNSENLIRKLRKCYAGMRRVSILDLCKNEDEEISAYGNLLFDKAYRTYCAKQWGLPPDGIDRSVLDRVMMSMDYDERYIDRDYQYMFKGGFTKLFENILSHPNISLELNCDAVSRITIADNKALFDGMSADILVFTGALDELFGLEYGRLPYRSLDITYEWYDSEKVLPEAITSHPQAVGYTRKTEYRRLMDDDSKAVGSIVATEYPIEYTGEKGQTPYWPVLNSQTRMLYDRYREKAAKLDNLYLCGRLAEFKYYNMDDCIIRALSVADEICEKVIAKGNLRV